MKDEEAGSPPHLDEDSSFILHPSSLTLGILGGGRAAWAYGSAWRRAGWPIAGVWLREDSQSRVAELLVCPRRTIEELASASDLILVAVSDSSIAEIAERVPKSGATVFHASGAVASVAGGFSLHPLKVLPRVGEPSDLRGSLLVFEGAHREIAERIAAGIGARFAEVDRAMKPLYHAGAVFGANYVAALLEIADRLMQQAGVRDAKQDIAALAVSAVENWRAHHDAARFTGPAARGDNAVIERHMEALAGDAQASELYKLLAAEIAGSILARSK